MNSLFDFTIGIFSWNQNRENISWKGKGESNIHSQSVEDWKNDREY